MKIFVHEIGGQYPKRASNRCSSYIDLYGLRRETVAFGADLRGTLWERPDDKFGVAFVGNGISRNHRRYLALGGLGLDLGDGRLTYGPEKIVECYYNLPIPLHSGFFGALDIQYVDNPGYNRDRGPAIVLGTRLHVEL